MILKMSTFNFFPNLGLEGWGHQISIFSQIQISPHYPGGGGGQDNYGLFPQFRDIFSFEGSP